MNKYNRVWQLLEEDFHKDSNLFAGPSTRQERIDAQKMLTVQFEQYYSMFLEKFGGGIVGSKFIFGVKPISLMGNNLNTVVLNTLFYKDQDWPGIDDWYIVSDDGFGNPIGIDPDGKVWLSDHDSGFEKVKLADSFEEFLYKLLTDTLYEE